jgi:hypothetical protein
VRRTLGQGGADSRTLLRLSFLILMTRAPPLRLLVCYFCTCDTTRLFPTEGNRKVEDLGLEGALTSYYNCG